MNLRAEFSRAGLTLAVTTLGTFYLTAVALVAAGVGEYLAGSVAIFIAALWALVYFEGVRTEVDDAE